MGGTAGVGGTGNGAGGAGWVGGIGGSVPDCAVGHAGTYVSCSWGAARKGRLGSWGALCMVGVIKQKVQKYSSSARVKLCIVDANGLSPKIGQGFDDA